MVASICAEKLNGGRSTLRMRTVRRSFVKTSRDDFVSSGQEIYIADGLPLGRGQSAGALTVTSDTQSLHFDSLVLNGGRSMIM